MIDAYLLNALSYHARFTIRTEFLFHILILNQLYNFLVALLQTHVTWNVLSQKVGPKCSEHNLAFNVCWALHSPLTSPQLSILVPLGAPSAGRRAPILPIESGGHWGELNPTL